MKKEKVGLLIGAFASALLAMVLLTGWTDYDADWKVETKFFTTHDFGNTLTLGDSGSTLGGAASIMSAAGVDSFIVRSPAQAGPRIREIGSTDIVGWRMANGDEISTTFMMPNDFDNRFGIAYRTHWASNSGIVRGQVTFRYLTRAISPNGLIVATLHGSGVDSLTATADSCTAAGTGVRYNYTKWDTVTNSTVRYYNNKMIKLGLRMVSATGDLVDSTYVLGAEIAYVPKKTTGSGFRQKILFIEGPTVLGTAKGTYLTKP